MNLLKESHPTKDLREFIKSIIETKSKEEEDNIIRRGLESLKTGISQRNPSNAKMIEYCMRAIYSDMLGHNVGFSHVFAIKMIESKNIHVKRIGYLASTLLLPQDSDLKILVVASLQRDLSSRNDLEVISALNSLNKLINESFAVAFVPSLGPLADSKNPYIRKKALIAMHRVEHLIPGSIPNFADRIKQALLEADFSVVSTAVGIILEECQQRKELYASTLKPLSQILKQVLEKKMMYYDYQKIPEPYLQLKILKIFAILAHKDKSASEEVYAVVEKCLGRSDNLNTDVSYALVYENILTICALYYNKVLLDLASAAVAKFLNPSLSNSNMIYLGIMALNHITQIDPAYLQDHQTFVINCIESPDETIKRITLELLCKNASPVNIETITTRLTTNLLTTTDVSFKQELTRKIFDLAVVQAADVQWFVRKLHELLATSAELFTAEMINSGIRIFQEHLEDSLEFGNLLVAESTKLLSGSQVLSDNVVKVTAWVLGHVGSRVRHSPEELLELFRSLVHMMSLKLKEEVTKVWILDSIQIVSRAASFEGHAELKSFLSSVGNSSCYEVQRKVSELGNGAFSKSLLEYNKHDFDSRLTFLLDFANTKKGKFYSAEMSEKISGLRHHKANFGDLKLVNDAVLERGFGEVQGQAGKEEGLKMEGSLKNPKWTLEGYHSDKKETRPEQGKKVDMFANMDTRVGKKPERQDPVKEKPQQLRKQDLDLFAKSNETDLFSGVKSVPSGSQDQQSATDLWGLEIVKGKPVQAQKPQNNDIDFDILGGSSAPQTAPKTADPSDGFDIFDSAPADPNAISPTPFKIDEEQYQNYWESFNPENEGKLDIPGSILAFINNKKFALVSEDEDDYITAAKSQNNVLLLYLKRVSGSRFEYIVKAPTAELAKRLSEYIKRN